VATVSDFARAFDTTPNTIRTWAAEFAEFLSPQANPQKGQTRVFNEADGRVLALVGAMRADGAFYEQIRAALASGERGQFRARQAPDAAGEPEDESDDSRAMMTRLTATVARFEGELAATREALEHTRAELEAERQARIEAERQAARLAGQLEGQQAQTQAERPSLWHQFFGRRRG
jgi:DNA-binding transcriptional MerR regulator